MTSEAPPRKQTRSTPGHVSSAQSREGPWKMAGKSSASMTERGLYTSTILRVVLGRETTLDVADDDNRVTVDVTEPGITEVEIDMDVELHPVTLASGEKTFITDELLDYIDHNGTFRVNGKEYDHKYMKDDVPRL